MKPKIEDIKIGMRFIGNINGHRFTVVGLQGGAVILMDESNGHEFIYGTDALKRCNLTLLE